MKEQFKKFLNEEQDPKAIEKIASKLSDYESKLDSFINAFIARERVLHTESLN